MSKGEKEKIDQRMRYLREIIEMHALKMPKSKWERGREYLKVFINWCECLLFYHHATCNWDYLLILEIVYKTWLLMLSQSVTESIGIESSFCNWHQEFHLIHFESAKNFSCVCCFNFGISFTHNTPHGCKELAGALTISKLCAYVFTS